MLRPYGMGRYLSATPLTQLVPGLKVNTSFNRIGAVSTGLEPKSTGSLTSRLDLDISSTLESLSFAQSTPLPTSMLANISQKVSSAIGSIRNTNLFNGAKSGVTITQFPQIKTAGSHNVVITTSGTSPASNTRFVRKELVSVLAE